MPQLQALFLFSRYCFEFNAAAFLALLISVVEGIGIKVHSMNCHVLKFQQIRLSL
jgi:hypothetical protein